MANATLVDGSSLDRVDLLMLTLDFDSLMRRLADSPEWDCSSVAVSTRWQLYSVGYDVLNPVSVDDVLIESHVSMCRSRRQFVASHDRVALEHEAWELVVIHFVKPLALLRVHTRDGPCKFAYALDTSHAVGSSVVARPSLSDRIHLDRACTGRCDGVHCCDREGEARQHHSIRSDDGDMAVVCDAV